MVVKYASYHKEKVNPRNQMSARLRTGRTAKPRIRGRAPPEKRCISAKRARRLSQVAMKFTNVITEARAARAVR